MQLTRLRLIALLRRWLLVTTGLALLLAVVVGAVGAGRPYWVIATLAIALVPGGFALARPVSQRQAARLLDRDLKLHDQLTTAHELQLGRASRTGLVTTVIEEATTQIRKSLSDARITAQHATAEWVVLSIAVGLLGLTIALPDYGRSVASPGTGHAENAAALPAGKHTALSPRRSAARKAAVSRSPRSVALPPNVTPTKRRGMTPTRPITPRRGHQEPAGAKPEDRHAMHAPRNALANARGTNLALRSGPGVTASTGQRPVGARGRRASSQASRARASAVQSRTATAKTTPTSVTVDKHGVPRSSRSAQGSRSGASAGTAKGAAMNKRGPLPSLGTGSKRLPVQAGFAPARRGRGDGHTRQSHSRGGGGGRGGRSGRAATGDSQTPASFPVLPATFNTPLAANEQLLRRFFGTTNQLPIEGW